MLSEWCCKFDAINIFIVIYIMYHYIMYTYAYNKLKINTKIFTEISSSITEIRMFRATIVKRIVNAHNNIFFNEDLFCRQIYSLFLILDLHPIFCWKHFKNKTIFKTLFKIQNLRKKNAEMFFLFLLFSCHFFKESSWYICLLF